MTQRMEHCDQASFVIKGDGIGWVKCDKIVGDCFWIQKHGKCPKGITIGMDRTELSTLTEVRAWGEKHGRDTIPGFVDARISHILREMKGK